LRFDALFTIPAQQVGAFFTEAWGAFRRSSAYPDVPPLAPSLGLVGEALLDRTFTLMTSVMVGVPVPETVRRMVDDLVAAHAFYGARGWLADPLGYHRTPPPVPAVERRSGRTFAGTRLMKYEHVSFPSGWAPHEGEPGRERWLAHPLNGAAHVYVLQHEEPRPWLVGVHGFAMGTPLINFSGFPVRMLHEELGLTLHPFDLATNKVLALVGRVEVRDWVDVITCSEQLQPLGFLAWAACGKGSWRAGKAAASAMGSRGPRPCCERLGGQDRRVRSLSRPPNVLYIVSCSPSTRRRSTSPPRSTAFCADGLRRRSGPWRR